jgi:hypothetical protein
MIADMPENQKNLNMITLPTLRNIKQQAPENNRISQ